MKNNPKTTKRKSKEVDAEKEIAPLVIDGSFTYQLTISGTGYSIDMGERNMQNDLCAILIAKTVSERMKTDFGVYKQQAKTKEQKAEFDFKLNNLSRSISSLGDIGENMLLTLLMKAQKPSEANNSEDITV